MIEEGGGMKLRAGKVIGESDTELEKGKDHGTGGLGRKEVGGWGSTRGRWRTVKKLNMSGMG